MYKWDDLSPVMRTNTISKINDRIGKQSAYMYLDRKVKKLVGKNGERYLLVEVSKEVHENRYADIDGIAAQKKIEQLLEETSMSDEEVTNFWNCLHYGNFPFKKMSGMVGRYCDWSKIEES